MASSQYGSVELIELTLWLNQGSEFIYRADYLEDEKHFLIANFVRIYLLITHKF